MRLAGTSFWCLSIQSPQCGQHLPRPHQGSIWSCKRKEISRIVNKSVLLLATAHLTGNSLHSDIAGAQGTSAETCTLAVTEGRACAQASVSTPGVRRQKERSAPPRARAPRNILWPSVLSTPSNDVIEKEKKVKEWTLPQTPAAQSTLAHLVVGESNWPALPVSVSLARILDYCAQPTFGYGES